MPAPKKYDYPEQVGAETRNPALDKKKARRTMSNASKRALNMGIVYRCHYDGVHVIIRRAA